MRINLTKKNLINSIYMQIGFSKKISENLLEDTLNYITLNIINSKKLNAATGIPLLEMKTIAKTYRALEENEEGENE